MKLLRRKARNSNPEPASAGRNVAVEVLDQEPALRLPRNVGYVQTVHTVMAINRGLMVIMGLLVLGLVLAIGGLILSRDWLTVYLPPDPGQGGFVEVGTPGPPLVWSFASQTLQSLHHWPVDGEKDYLSAIERNTVFLTPAFRRALLEDRRNLMNRFGLNELKGRSRALHLMPEFRFDPAHVEVLGPGVWAVDLRYRLVETVETSPIKDALIGYRLRVVQADVDPNGNVWGLQLDGFIQQPERLEVSQ